MSFDWQGVSAIGTAGLVCWHPVCGGPIDVMVFQTAPEPRTLAYPGKELHHPHRRGYKT